MRGSYAHSGGLEDESEAWVVEMAGIPLHVKPTPTAAALAVSATPRAAVAGTPRTPRVGGGTHGAAPDPSLLPPWHPRASFEAVEAKLRLLL